LSYQFEGQAKADKNSSNRSRGNGYPVNFFFEDIDRSQKNYVERTTAGILMANFRAICVQPIPNAFALLANLQKEAV
jgi:hypothetical protein